MNIEQERKYDIVGGFIVNRATGKPIPDDEPIMIIRAKDIFAVETLKYYKGRSFDQLHRKVIEGRIEDFMIWQSNNPDAMKVPDSDKSCLK